MTGFLASLAARSTGHERVLEPRRLLFEPHDEPPIEAEPAPQPQRLQAKPHDERDGTPAPLPERAEPVRPPARAVEEHATVASAQEETARRTTARRAPQPPPRRAAKRHLVDPEPGLAPAAPPAARVTAPPLTASAQRPSRVLSPPVRVRAPLAATPPPAARSRLRSPPAPGAAAEEQVVRITIGRVDVRAMQPPTEQAPRPRPAPPRMTLAEYLARGRGS